MFRSEIIKSIDEAIEFIEKNSGSLKYLSPENKWNLENWVQYADFAHQYKDREIGWDVTDFGSGDFKKYGGVLLTQSNSALMSNPPDQPFSRKLIYRRKGQKAPRHYHKIKSEDVICLAGTIEVKLWYKKSFDGIFLENGANEVHVPSGGTYLLMPGNSIHIPAGTWHSFKTIEGPSLVQEVAAVNNDYDDNFWYRKWVVRHPEVTEDLKPKSGLKYIMCNELPGTKKFDELKRLYLR